jgi:hypothetical protein
MPDNNVFAELSMSCDGPLASTAFDSGVAAGASGSTAAWAAAAANKLAMNPA